MRAAWFSPLPPVRSGIAAYSAELLPHLRDTFVIDSYPETAAHDFVWRQRRSPYDTTVYQLGNAPCHDYMWAYLAHYPGLVVLHDAKLHHARARQLLQHGRADDYRREFAFDDPEGRGDFVDYAVAGLGGPVYYLWRMLAAVMHSARLVAVHSPLVAEELRAEYPRTRIETIRMGVPPGHAPESAGVEIRRRHDLPEDAIVFATFGKVTAEKRIAAIFDALGLLLAEGRNAYLLLVGDADGYPALQQRLTEPGVTARVRVTGYVPDEQVGHYLMAADACLCLRWPTAQESSASWLRCLAARRATILTDLAHLVDIPRDVALRVDLLDERRSLLAAMRALADNAGLREQIADAGRTYWRSHHTLEIMAADYRQLLESAAALPAPDVSGLPAHFLSDHSEVATSILDRFAQDRDLVAVKPRNG